MNVPKMCEACEREYKNPLDRRIPRRAIGCRDCGANFEPFLIEKKEIAYRWKQGYRQIDRSFWREGEYFSHKGG